MIVDSIKENNLIAKEYKELLKISYQSLSKDDRKLIRLAFNTSVDAHKNQEENLENLMSSIQLLLLK